MVFEMVRDRMHIKYFYYSHLKKRKDVNLWSPMLSDKAFGSEMHYTCTRGDQKVRGK